MTTIKPRKTISVINPIQNDVYSICVWSPSTMVSIHVDRTVHCCCQPLSFQLQHVSPQRSSHSVLPRGRRAIDVKIREEGCIQGTVRLQKKLNSHLNLISLHLSAGFVRLCIEMNCNQIKVRGQSRKTEAMVTSCGDAHSLEAILHQPRVQLERIEQ